MMIEFKASFWSSNLSLIISTSNALADLPLRAAAAIVKMMATIAKTIISVWPKNKPSC